MVAGSSKVVIIVAHEKRRFPEAVDYVTCPGPKLGRGRLRELIIVTDRCVLRCDARAPRLRLMRLMPGQTLESVQERTGFLLEPAPDTTFVELPSPPVLRTLRETVDPDALYRTR